MGLGYMELIRLIFILLFFSSAVYAGPPQLPMHLFKGGGTTGFNSSSPVGAPAKVLPSAGDINLTRRDVGSVVLMTAAGEVRLTDCSASTIGDFYTIFVRDASEQVQLVDGEDLTDVIRLKAGTELDANDEADLPIAGNQAITVMCMESGKWYVIAGDAACTDGGAAD
jgi:hypothetical protein